jgi:hypothetical protein
VAIELARGDLVLRVGQGSRVDPRRLVNLLTQAGSGVRVAPDHRIFAPVVYEDAAGLYDSARALLTSLGA